MSNNMEKNIFLIVPPTAKFIEDRAKEFYEKREDQINFILSCCVNLLGNLTMLITPDSIFEKQEASIKVMENLGEWYNTAFDYLKNQKKDGH